MSSCMIQSRCVSHRGYVRQQNEDAVLDFPAAGLWAVADGMGGHECGSLASRTVIASLYALGCRGSGSPLVTQMAKTLRGVNNALLGEARRLGAASVVGSTVAVLVLAEDAYHCFWAGDSRIYLWRDEQLRQLTADHVEQGGCYAGAITRAVGAFPQLELGHVQGHSYERDVFLLCSDGLTGMVDDRTIAFLLRQHGAIAGCDALLSAALRAGGADNISCIIVALEPHSTSSRRQ